MGAVNILVVGATGTVGRHLVPLLAQRGASVRVATRNPRAPGELAAGARAVELDLDRPETFGPALAGVERAFLMARTGEPRPFEVGSLLLAAMEAAGVRHVVNMTGLGIEKSEALPLRRLEIALERSGMAFTHVRPSYFLQNFCSGPLRAGIALRDEIAVAAGDAAISFVDARDIAAVAAEALSSPRHESRAYAVTGGAAVTHAEIAEAIAEARGRPVTYRALSEDEARRALAADGLPPERIAQRLGFLAVARTGALSAVSPDVEAVLGRAPISLRAFARDHAALWRKEVPR